MGIHHFGIFRDTFGNFSGRISHWMAKNVPVRFDLFKSSVSAVSPLITLVELEW